MARRKSLPYGKTNWDSCDGVKPHRLKEIHLVSRYAYNFTVWDHDNVTFDDNGHVHVSINKRMRNLNARKCRRMNGYNGKINGR